MKKKTYSETQILSILKAYEAGAKVSSLAINTDFIETASTNRKSGTAALTATKSSIG